jgi:hypothetical protein
MCCRAWRLLRHHRKAQYIDTLFPPLQLHHHHQSNLTWLPSQHLKTLMISHLQPRYNPFNHLPQIDLDLAYLNAVQYTRTLLLVYVEIWPLRCSPQSPVFLPPSSLAHQPSPTVTHTHNKRLCTFHLGPIDRCTIPLYTTATANANARSKFPNLLIIPYFTCLSSPREICNAASSHSRTVQHDFVCRVRNCRVVCCSRQSETWLLYRDCDPVRGWEASKSRLVRL